MEIGWGNGNRERKGFGERKCMWGEENMGVGERNFKGTWFLCTYPQISNDWKRHIFLFRRNLYTLVPTLFYKKYLWIVVREFLLINITVYKSFMRWAVSAHELKKVYFQNSVFVFVKNAFVHDISLNLATLNQTRSNVMNNSKTQPIKKLTVTSTKDKKKIWTLILLNCGDWVFCHCLIRWNIPGWIFPPKMM